MSWDDFVQSLTYDEESMGEEAWQQYLGSADISGW